MTGKNAVPRLLRGRRDGGSRLAVAKLVVLSVVASTTGIVAPEVIGSRPPVAGAVGTYEGAVLADAPVSYWPLDDAPGSTARDATGPNIGFVQGGVTPGAPGPFAGSTAFRFDGGACSGVDIGRNPTSLATQRFTIENWFRTDTAASGTMFRWRFYGYAYASGGDPIGVGVWVNNRDRSAGGGQGAADGTWHHGVVMYTGSSLDVYLDGEKVAEQAVTGTVNYGSAGPNVAIGRDGNACDGQNASFRGDMAQVAFYGHALSAERVKAHFCAGSPAGAGCVASKPVLPLAMIHGFGGDADDFKDMQRYYEDKYSALKGRIVRPTLKKRESIERNAGLMEEPIADLLERSGGSQVNILAHSKGGLDARLYAWDHPGQVRQVMMLGTPNGGSRLADIVCGAERVDWWGPAPFVPSAPLVPPVLRSKFGKCDGPRDGLYQLQQSYVQDVFNKQVPDRSSTFFTTIAGTGNDKGSLLIDGEDDGYVSVASVEYLSAFNGDHPGHHYPRGRYDITHEALLRPDRPAAPRSICTLYLATCATVATSSAPSVSSASVDAVSAGTIDAAIAGGEPSQVAGAAVPAGGVADVVLHLEGAPAAGIVVVASGPVTATVDDTPLTATEMLGADVLAAVVPGAVRSTLHLANDGSSAVDVAVLVWVESGRRLTVDAAPVLSAPGEPVEIVAELSESAGGDALRAVVTDEAGAVVADVALAGGAARWTGSFTPDAPGTYLVTAAVGGRRPRYATDTFVVASGVATITGVSDTTVRDDDANGLWDTLDATVDLDVTEPGAYRVAAQLVDTAGAPVASAGARAGLDPGARTMTVSFDGHDIAASGRSGPYVVANLVLSRDDGGMALEHTMAGGAATAPYDAWSFEHASVQIEVNGFTDQGVDPDGDGRFDRLDVGGRVGIDTGGSYVVDARLVASNGADLGAFRTVATFVPGWNGFTLSFPWEPMRAAGIDGPYAVEDLSIAALEDPEVLGDLLVAHHTAAYPATGEIGITSFAGLRALLEAAEADGGISNGDLARSLRAKLDAAEGAYERGDVTTARNVLDAFRNELSAQRGTQVSEAAYLALDTGAEQLSARL